jgi:hypothetical protein
MVQPNLDFLNDTEIDYSEYNLLSNYQKRCLPATNYWRIMTGLEEIKVPESDKEYYKYFDKRCYDIVKSRKLRKP